ncbi:MAG: DUF3106 domain-containing protein [Verrucomicrobiota bacterium]
MPPAAIVRSPVETFRALLVMPAADRKAQLAARPPEARQRLLDKIREYQSLSPEERDLRLKATELQWYLKLLLTAPATNRVTQLESVPENLRDMVAGRLKQWDALPPALQQLMLTNQAGPEYFVRHSATNLPPLPPDFARNRLVERYNRLFELTAEEKAKVLATLSEAEQRQMEKTLQSYKQLTAQQRAQCIRSFAKFATLSAAERQEFTKNAERWAQMPPAERQAWRELVSTAPNLPPLPELTIQRPPLPPDMKQRPSVPSTNGG